MCSGGGSIDVQKAPPPPPQPVDYVVDGKQSAATNQTKGFQLTPGKPQRPQVKVSVASLQNDLILPDPGMADLQLK